MSNAPIGVFDSGLGGLTVAAEILKQLPNERIVYFGDTAHVPYGERPLEEIQQFALGITQYLLDKGAKIVVMACNMSSAVALETASRAFPEVPILGVIIPGSRAAVKFAGTRPVGILATSGTVKSGAYVRTINSMDPSIEVVQQACPPFVPLVEAGKADTEEAEEAARVCVAPLVERGVGTIVLGCTHYPFLRRPIELSAGSDVRLVDPAEETVREVYNTLQCRNLLAVDSPQEGHSFYTSSEAGSFKDLGSRFLGREIERVDLAVWGVDVGKVSYDSSGRTGERSASPR